MQKQRHTLHEGREREDRFPFSLSVLPGRTLGIPDMEEH